MDMMCWRPEIVRQRTVGQGIQAREGCFSLATGEGLAETLAARITRTSALKLQSSQAKETYAKGSGLDGPTFPDDPDTKIEQVWRVGKAGDYLPFYRNWTLIDLRVEALTKGD